MGGRYAIGHDKQHANVRAGQGTTARPAARDHQAQENHVDLTTVYDCMGSKLGTFPVPEGVLLAGYVTGNGGVPWTPAQFAAHPDAIRIDQSPENTAPDETADVIDIENDAATLADLPQWVHAAWGNYHASVRPGQRQPAPYMSRTTVTPVVNTLIAAGITSGIGLWLAAPMQSAMAAQLVNDASGPFPIIGVQYAFLPDHDVSVFSTEWLNTVSGKTPATPPGPGTQEGWNFCSKCKGLFFGPEQDDSFCPLNGRHDGSQSHNYTLPFSL